MKKKYIQLGVLAALFLGMLGAFVLLQKAPDAETPEESAAEKTYVTGGAAALHPVQIDIKNETGNYSIINRAPGEEEHDLIIKGWDTLSLDAYALGQAETSAKGMEAKRIAAENADPATLSDYGLDKPRAEAVIRYDNGETAEILIGADAPGSEGIYVKRGGAPDVYLVASSAIDPFLRSDRSYINRTVTASDPKLDGYDRIVLSGTKYPEPIVIVSAEENPTGAAGASFRSHTITSPVKASLDTQTALLPLHSVYGLIASDVAAIAGGDSGTLEKYGLAEPYAVISVTGSTDDPDASFELRFSEADSGGNLHVIKTGSPVIYELNESIVPWLAFSLFDYMEKNPVTPDIADVSSVTLTLARETYDFTLAGEGDDLIVSLNGSPLPDAAGADGTAVSGTKNFRQFYETLISARYDSPADDAAPPDGAVPLAQIEYRYKDGKTPDVVAFYAGPIRKAFISLNGGAFYLCQSAYVDRLIGDAGKLAAGETVKAYI